jgi:hypothetical protein
MDWLADDYDNFGEIGGFLSGFEEEGDLVVPEDDVPADNSRNWQQYNRKSAAAERRETEARGAFLKIREATEKSATSSIVVQILTPRFDSARGRGWGRVSSSSMMLRIIL